MNDLCRQAVEKKELILHSETSTERNFISMSDICLGIDHFLQIYETHLDCSPFNLCSENNLTLQELSQSVALRCTKVLGYTPKLINFNHDNEINFNKKLNLNTNKTHETGLNLQQNLEQEIDNTLLFCKTHFFLEDKFK